MQLRSGVSKLEAMYASETEAVERWLEVFLTIALTADVVGNKHPHPEILMSDLDYCMMNHCIGCGERFIEYAIISLIPQLDANTRAEVQEAFSIAMRTMFKAMAGFAAFGLCADLLTREIPLNREIDKERALRERDEVVHVEKDHSASDVQSI